MCKNTDSTVITRDVPDLRYRIREYVIFAFAFPRFNFGILAFTKMIFEYRFPIRKIRFNIGMLNTPIIQSYFVLHVQRANR